MIPKRLAQLPQLFRGPFLRKIACKAYYPELVERLNYGGLPELLDCELSDIFTKVYDVLLKHYRAEYVYKNSLTKAWLGQDSGLEKAFVTDEFRVGKNRVDLAIFAKNAFAYEIKSEFDSTLRVLSQTNECAKVFDRVYVVTSEGMKTKIEAAIPDKIGMITLQESGELIKVRESASHAKQISLGVTFDCLRQSEMIAIANNISAQNINVPSSRVYIECRSKFRQLLPFEAHKLAAEQFRNRKYSVATQTLLQCVPNALKHAALTFRASNEEMNQLREELLNKPKPYRAPRIKKTTTKTSLESYYEQLSSVTERKTKRITVLRAFPGD